MDLKIIHIEDEKDIIENVKNILDGEELNGYTLRIVHSCGFQEGMEKLASNQYDLVILDLCVGSANEESERLGLEVFKKIQERSFIPIVFFTGLPKYVRQLQSDIVKVVGKAEGFEALMTQISAILSSGTLKIKQEIDQLVQEGIRSYFWDFVHQNSPVIEQMAADKTSLKYLLLRRLGKVFSQDIVRTTDADAVVGPTFSHPMEFYIYPPLSGEYESGYLVKSKKNGEIFTILTPSCDFVVRTKGTRNAEKVLLCYTKKITELDSYKKLDEIKAAHKAKLDAGGMLSNEDKGQLKNLEAAIKNSMKPNFNERYFFLPPTPFIEACFIDFQDKISIPYDELNSQYEIIASLDDPIAQAVQSTYSRYHSRIGYGDLDVDDIFQKI